MITSVCLFVSFTHWLPIMFIPTLNCIGHWWHPKLEIWIFGYAYMPICNTHFFYSSHSFIFRHQWHFNFKLTSSFLTYWLTMQNLVSCVSNYNSFWSLHHRDGSRIPDRGIGMLLVWIQESTGHKWSALEQGIKCLTAFQAPRIRLPIDCPLLPPNVLTSSISRTFDSLSRNVIAVLA